MPSESGETAAPSAAPTTAPTATTTPDYDLLLNPPEAARSYSGAFHSQSMLDSADAWVPMFLGSGEHLTIDIGTSMEVVGVATQGRAGNDHWVTAFTVQAGPDGTSWSVVGNLYGGLSFDGNSDRSTKVLSYFAVPHHVRYVRLLPTGWTPSEIAMRAGVLVRGMTPTPTTASPTTAMPSVSPSVSPSASPTSASPSSSPTTELPSVQPSASPSASPTTAAPSASPTLPAPSTSPTTASPTTAAPMASPTVGFPPGGPPPPPLPAAPLTDRQCEGFLIVDASYGTNRLVKQETTMWHLSFGVKQLCDAEVLQTSPSFPCYDMASGLNGDFVADGEVNLFDLSLMLRMLYGGVDMASQYLPRSFRTRAPSTSSARPPILV